MTHYSTNESYLDDFLSSGFEEAKSPFLTPQSRHWGYLLPLKTACTAASLWVIAFICSFSPLAHPIETIALLLVYFILGVPAIIETIEAILDFHIDLDVLMTLAAFAAVLIGSPVEGALLLVLFALSGAMEDAVTARARSALSKLHKLSPNKAYAIQPDGSLLERSIKDIVLGSEILVKAGEIVPLDGTIIAGSSAVNLAHLTGESVPVTKKVGDTVPAGAHTIEGSLTLKVIRTCADSTLTKMIELITRAHDAKPHLQRWLDQALQRYSIIIIILTIIFALSIPFFFSNIPYLGNSGAIYRALAFMIAASPCALIIAMPVAYLSAISISAKQGILLKGGITLDALASCDTIALDKTGTLTTGELHLDSVLVLETSSMLSQALSQEELIGLAAGLEANSKHPIAQTIVNYAKKYNIDSYTTLNIKSLPGFGLEGLLTLKGKEIFIRIGHLDFIKTFLRPEIIKKIDDSIHAEENQGKLNSILVVDQQVAIFYFKDTIRPSMAQILRELKSECKMNLLMLTGDHQINAEIVAKELKIDSFHGNLRPEDKLKHVSSLADKTGLIMVGDGINDAPALARATVGISMGKVGSSAAIDVSDVVLLQDNLGLLKWLIQKAKATKAIVRQNIILATLVIIGASISSLGGYIPLWLAVLLHEGGTIVVGLNSLRLLQK
ncbi:MAG: cadmium/zinc-transporting ATPase [Chlamydiales bacterium]|jgi:heavy metal translocating P-type ATPase|nr:cadmium/zinc-transporting ATPase [Chlamydiales bacterium]